MLAALGLAWTACGYTYLRRDRRRTRIARAPNNMSTTASLPPPPTEVLDSLRVRQQRIDRLWLIQQGKQPSDRRTKPTTTGTTAVAELRYRLKPRPRLSRQGMAALEETAPASSRDYDGKLNQHQIHRWARAEENLTSVLRYGDRVRHAHITGGAIRSSPLRPVREYAVFLAVEGLSHDAKRGPDFTLNALTTRLEEAERDLWQADARRVPAR